VSVLAELKKQNEMLEAQGKKQQAETSANDKNEKRKAHIKYYANMYAKLTDDYYRSLSDLANRFGGNVAYMSEYNALHQELSTKLAAESHDFDGSDDAFSKAVKAIAEAWYMKKKSE